jgi:hypothetical protein
MENDPDKYPVTAEYASGLYCLLDRTGLSPKAVKGR